MEGNHFVERIGVIGAGGFVGSRFFQIIRSGKKSSIVPIVRNYRSLARLENVLDSCRVVDTSNVSSLTEALRDCNVVVNLTKGDVLKILPDIKNIWKACRNAGVRRLIHISSAVVFGQVRDDKITDDSEPDIHHWMLYAREKANAELFLTRQMEQSELEIIIIRPGLIWGPTSTYCALIAQQLLNNMAWLSNKGEGICNLIYVDNLIKYILQAAFFHGNGQGSYNVGDSEIINWRTFYEGIALEIEVPSNAIALVDNNHFYSSPSVLFDLLLQQKYVYSLSRWILNNLSPDGKNILKRTLHSLIGLSQAAPPNTQFIQPLGKPRFSREWWYLQNTRRSLPHEKFINIFGDPDLILFDKAMASTGKWLRYAGFVPNFGSVITDNRGI